MNAFMVLGPAKAGNKQDLYKGFRSAIDSLTEPTYIQEQKLSESRDNSLKVVNKGRVIVITKLDSDEEAKKIKEKFHETLIHANKAAAMNENLMTINHCDLVIFNFCPSDYIGRCPQVKVSQDVSTFMSFEVNNLICGVSLAPKLCSLVLRHYDLASTTVTGIPMKEEQNASSSANYDVELFHPASAHAAILKGIPSETAHLKTVREGTDYETVTLKWCTPRSTASSELQHCSSAYRITSVDVISRPSSCLTNFLLNGRWVMLEMPRKSGSKVISHMLACHGGDIYIHTLYTSRSILEDPPSISEGCGGRVTDYRIPDFGDLIKANMLAPYPEQKVEEGEDIITPQEKSKERIKRYTKFWPVTLSSTSLFTLGSQIDPLITLIIKDELSEDEIVECKKVILMLMSMEARAEPLPTAIAGQRGKAAKREEQYRAMWTELEQFLRSHLHSENHEKVLQCLLECHNKAPSESQDFNNDDKVDIDQALKELDSFNYMTEREKNEYNQGKTSNISNKHLLIDSNSSETKKRKTIPPPLAPLGRSSGVNLLSLWENKIASEQSRRCLEFQGRLKAENNITPLYTNLQKDKDEVQRKK